MKRLRFVLIGLALVSACCALAAAWIWQELHAVGPLPRGGALVSVPPGEPFRKTTARLHAAGVIRHPWLLHWWGRWTGADRSVRSGDYRFDRALSPLAVLEKLRSPEAALSRVTVPEGKTLMEIASLLEDAGFGGADHFLCAAEDPAFLLSQDLAARTLEGYLFPDTYTFPRKTAPEAILAGMLERFREKMSALEERRRESGMTEHEVVTLASIIEKETGAGSERSLVSAVFHNRLRIGMRLQSDPTAVYGRRTNGRVTPKDLKVDSPYNTYLYGGLPPGPICSPGFAALEAALSPADVPYLYFVARRDGTHKFSRTLREHNRAVARLRRGARP
jgi:UPF0755 protein